MKSIKTVVPWRRVVDDYWVGEGHSISEVHEAIRVLKEHEHKGTLKDIELAQKL